MGYTRIQGALKNVGHQVWRSTIARILKAAGIPPSRARPTTWRTFMRAHWPVLLAADFFTTEVWTTRGLVTYYTAFVIELQSRRVRVLGSTPFPNEAFVIQCFQEVIGEPDALLRKDGSWSAIAIRSGARRWGSGSPRPAFASSELRRVRRTAMRMQNDLSGPSKRSA